jgi:YD repeat-containing protein
MFGDRNPTRLIYYVKKWRQEQSGNPRDQTVTFVFDAQDKVVAITSNADSIHSRP